MYHNQNEAESFGAGKGSEKILDADETGDGNNKLIIISLHIVHCFSQCLPRLLSFAVSGVDPPVQDKSVSPPQT